jgi:hypothetical protein
VFFVARYANKSGSNFKNVTAFSTSEAVKVVLVNFAGGVFIVMPGAADKSLVVWLYIFGF